MGLLTAFGDLLRELIKFDSLKQLAPLLSGTAIAFRFTEAIWKWNEQRSETARRQALADERRDLESLLAGMPATSGTGPDDDESRLRIAVNQRLAQVNTELALTIAALAKPRQTSAAPIQRISWRRQLLVYWPSRQAAYVAHLCAWGAFAFVGIASIGVLADGFDEESAVALMLVTITALLTREWALSAEYDPPPARHHSFLRRAFLFYRPTRAIGWWSHVAFWYLVALVVGLAIESLSNQDYAMLGYSAGSGAFIAFLVHAWARHFDHSASTIGPASRTDHVGEAQIALQQPPRRHRAAAQSSWKPQQLLLLLVLCGGALLVGLLVGAGRTARRNRTPASFRLRRSLLALGLARFPGRWRSARPSRLCKQHRPYRLKIANQHLLPEWSVSGGLSWASSACGNCRISTVQTSASYCLTMSTWLMRSCRAGFGCGTVAGSLLATRNYRNSCGYAWLALVDARSLASTAPPERRPGRFPCGQRPR